VERHALERIAGQLGFGVVAVWGARARGAMRPIFDALSASLGGPRTAIPVVGALADCLAVRQDRLEHCFPSALVLAPPSDVSVLYSDAEGGGGWGAVSVLPPGASWVRGAAPSAFLALLTSRVTQIMALELAAALGALLVFSPPRGSTVILFIDNRAVVSFLVKGTAVPGDFRALVERALEWLHSRRIRLLIHYVPSALNCASCSRTEALLAPMQEKCGAASKPSDRMARTVWMVPSCVEPPAPYVTEQYSGFKG
jgi:hypothetical protein